MDKYFCDICDMELSGKAHFRVGDIEREYPKQSVARRVIFKDGDKTLETADEPWTWYCDLRLCDACFKKPIDLDAMVKKLGKSKVNDGKPSEECRCWPGYPDKTKFDCPVHGMSSLKENLERRKNR